MLHCKLLTDLNFIVFICDWYLDFLLCRKQTVNVGSFASGSKILNTGAPQDCVLSPLLYSSKAVSKALIEKAEVALTE